MMCAASCPVMPVFFSLGDVLTMVSPCLSQLLAPVLIGPFGSGRAAIFSFIPLYAAILCASSPGSVSVLPAYFALNSWISGAAPGLLPPGMVWGMIAVDFLAASSSADAALDVFAMPALTCASAAASSDDLTTDGAGAPVLTTSGSTGPLAYQRPPFFSISRPEALPTVVMEKLPFQPVFSAISFAVVPFANSSFTRSFFALADSGFGGTAAAPAPSQPVNWPPSGLPAGRWQASYSSKESWPSSPHSSSNRPPNRPPNSPSGASGAPSRFFLLNVTLTSCSAGLA